jgi:hypothetical protein
LHRYIDLVLYSAIVDPEIALAYFNVLMLINPPRSLFQPRLFARVLTVACKRAGKRLLRGKEEPGFALSSEALAALRALPSMRDARVS